MRQILRRVTLQHVADIAIIAAAVIVAATAINGQKSTPSPASDDPVRVKINEQAHVPGVTYAGHQKTLLLVVQSSCPYCTKSLGFYARLSRLPRTGNGLRVIAVGLEPADVLKSYVATAGVQVDDVVSVPQTESPSSITPTLILINGKGVVTHVWRGWQSEQGETEIIKAVS
jgi:hypothetical protein